LQNNRQFDSSRTTDSSTAAEQRTFRQLQNNRQFDSCRTTDSSTAAEQQTVRQLQNRIIKVRLTRRNSIIM
jgi:hypothetical protein